jgi:isopenicillin N synthase-like dioxygenase
MLSRIPELSLSQYTHGEPEARATFCRELFEGLQRYGFIILCDHPVPVALLDDAYRVSAELFALPEDLKRRYVRGPRGYVPFRTERAKNHTAPDLKEFWQIGPERADDVPRDITEPPNVWPETPARFKHVLLELFTALEQTGRIILEALTPGLGLPHDFFARMVDRGNSVLRLLHYPPVPDDIEPGSVRAAAHEDINLLTLLVAAQGAGLELLDRDGRWLPVVTKRNNLIVDSGDMLARMTNDTIPATTHRVVNPGVGDPGVVDPSTRNVSRYSMPFFMHPNSDAVLRCLPSCVGDGARYPEITAGTFLAQRLKEIGLL